VDDDTRRELDQIRGELSRQRQDGTTVAVLSTQLTTLAASVAEFKAAVGKRFDDHDRLHAEAEKERTSSRRWLIGTTIAALAMLIGMYGWVALLLHK
jgi:hypothetical protein